MASSFDPAELKSIPRSAKIAFPGVTKPAEPAPAPVAAPEAAEPPAPPAQTVDVAADQSAEPAPAPASPDPASAPVAKDRTEDRVADLLAERHALRQYGEYLLNENKRLQTEKAPAAAPQPAEAAEPTLEQFQYDTARWSQAHAQWTRGQIKKEVTAAVQGQVAQQEQQSARVAFETRAAEFRKSAPDFDVVAQNFVGHLLPQLGERVAAQIVGSEQGPAIMHYLGTHPDIATRISRMGEDQRLMRLGQIASELTKPTSRATSTTKAPPPPSVTAPSGSSGIPKADPSKMTMKEFVEHERRQAKERRERLRARH